MCVRIFNGIIFRGHANEIMIPICLPNSRARMFNVVRINCLHVHNIE